MTDTIHRLIEHYGLIAVFLGCLAEGESAAILAGFFTHQHVFPAAGSCAAVFGGAFLGDTLFFMAGRGFAHTEAVGAVRRKPGFRQALDLVEKRPATYVLLNRYAYGFRIVGGVAAGVSTLPLTTFLSLNALSSAVWATLFLTIGYVFGAGAEHVIGDELMRHHRLLIGIGIGLSAAILAGLAAHAIARRANDQ